MARPRQIDRDAVLAASLALADDEGLDALTMAAVARRLGVTPMALYRHVQDKADLLDGVVERLLDEIPEPDPDLDPAAQLRAAGRALRATARRHPGVFPLLLQRPATTPGARRARDQVVTALRGAGVHPAAAARVERLVSTMVLGFATSEVSGRFAAHSRRTLDADYRALEEMIFAAITLHLPDRD
jgi:AcrR family transcriptional regulator